jgi:class 3 adenylate cyclase/tetratricopeptide (TPR) repeat protein
VQVCSKCGRQSPDDFQFCPSCATPLAPPASPREVRKVVTVVFCDVTGSTSLGERLDPESMRKVMSRYFEDMKGVLERHGGTVEKFIGDAVMAVFGIPHLHEDDALRAVRAASEMREALEALNKELERDLGTTLSARIGVNTGEVVAGEPSGGQALVTGDAVNTAARLEQGAQPGEILIGQNTFQLVRDAVSAQPLDPLALKGKEGTVSALRLLQVMPGVAGRARRMDSPMVGRQRELALLRQAFDRAVSDRACQLFTILAPPGVGKSRLVEEFLRRIQGGAILRGRCLPYGEGITFYPVIETVKQAAGLADFDAPDVVEEKICAVLEADEHRELVCGRVAQLLGVADAAAPEETFWAIRRFFEAVARERALALVFDDVHWGEATFLDLIEHVAEWSRGVPILLLCLARPDLLNVRPGWGGGKLNTSTVSLEPLSREESEALIANLLGTAEVPREVAGRIAAAAEGTPLFVEEMLSMLIDDGLLVREDGEWIPTSDLAQVAVPPTIHALIAARLDQLSPDERVVLGAASVVGKEFFLGAVRDLVSGELHGSVPLHVMSFVRKELVRPERSTLPGDEAFRFRHLLIRDAAYEAMPKETRTQLHERYADWLERVAGERIDEQEEILGYHLEQSYRYRVELGRVDQEARSVAHGAAGHLAAAGRRASERGDASAAANLFARAADLTSRDDSGRPPLLLELGGALFDAGQIVRAIEVLDETLASGAAAGDRPTEWRARVEQVWMRPMVETDRPWGNEQDRVAEEAIAVFESLGDDLGLAKAWRVRGDVRLLLGHIGEMVSAFERSLAYARRADSSREIANAAIIIGGGLYYGPTPVEEAIGRLRELRHEFGHLPRIRLWGVGLEATEALQGQFDEARSGLEEMASTAREYGDRWAMAGIAWQAGSVERLAGDSAEAERRFREAFEAYSAMGERARLSTLTGELALALADQGKYEEALRFAETSRELGGPDDAATQILWREAQARARAGLGELPEAETVAREALAIARPTDLWRLGDLLVALAEILHAQGRTAEAKPLVEEAVGLYERKGAALPLERARRMLEQI